LKQDKGFSMMESWQVDFEWLRVRHIVKDAMQRPNLPDFQTVLFLIGIQELGHWHPGKNFTKEEKQDLMHIGMCTLLEKDGYYSFEGRDQDGWPHWKEEKPFDIVGVEKQEQFLIVKAIEYFQDLEQFNGGFQNNN
jgi:hypothetical protein